MKIFIFVFLLVFFSGANSFAKKTTALIVDYSCIGLDQIPIPYGQLGDECCANGFLKPNPSARCRAGFNTIVAETAGDGAKFVIIANTAIQNAKDTTGGDTDFTDHEKPSDKKDKPDTAAVTYDPTGGDDGSTGGKSGSGKDSKGKVDTGKLTSGSGSGSGSRAGSAGGAGGLGSAGGTSGPKGLGANGTDALNGQGKDGDGRLAYIGSGGEGDGEGHGSGGSGSGAGGVAISGEGMTEANFAGDEDGAEGVDGSSGDFSDDDPNSTTQDASDYLKRIDPSANIFKIVSARYFKKKTLWPRTHQ